MKFINQIGPKTVRLAFMVAFLNVASCGGDKKRFCNCAFDCLTEEGIEYHNVTLSDSYIDQELHGWREPWRLAEAAKKMCMERLMARVTVIGKKEKDEEPQRRTEQIMDRKQNQLQSTPAPPPKTRSTNGEIGGNLNVFGLVWILAVVVCAATATAATIVVATVLKLQTSRSPYETPAAAARSVSIDHSLASVGSLGTLKRVVGAASTRGIGIGPPLASTQPGGGSQIVINIPATTLPRPRPSANTVTKKRDEFRSCDSIWSSEKATSTSFHDHQGNCQCHGVMADPSMLYGVSVIEQNKIRESSGGSSYYGFTHNYNNISDCSEEDNEEAGTTGSSSSSGDSNNVAYLQCLTRH